MASQSRMVIIQLRKDIVISIGKHYVNIYQLEFVKPPPQPLKSVVVKIILGGDLL